MTTEKFQLPLQKFLPEIGQAILKYDMTYIQSDTGTGKSTGVPMILSKLLNRQRNLDRQKIYVSEHSNLAVSVLANFLHKSGYSVGHTNDYNKQNEWNIDILYTHHKYLCSKLSHEIGHKFFSLGTNYKWPMAVIILDDVQLLNQYGIAVLKLVEYAYNCWKQTPDKLSKPPKLVLMGSDISKISSFFVLPQEQILIYKCSLKNIDIEYGLSDTENLVNPDDDKIYYRAVSKTVDYYKKGKAGHYMIFAPGRYEAEFMYSELMHEMKKEFNHAEKYSIYLIKDETIVSTIIDILAKTNQRTTKCIIITTNICEMSITFPNISLVIDTMTDRYIPSTLDMLENKFIRHISKNRSIERMGRTGRTCDGTYVPIMNSKQYANLEDELTEIHDYSQSIVLMKSNHLNVESVYDFPDVTDYLNFLTNNKIYDSGGDVDKLFLEIIRNTELSMRFQLIIWKMLQTKIFNYCPYHLLLLTVLTYYGNGIIILPKKRKTESLLEYRNRIDMIKTNIMKKYGGYSDVDTIINICIDITNTNSDQNNSVLKKYCHLNYLSYRRLSHAFSAYNNLKLNKIFRNKLIVPADVIDDEISSEFFELLDKTYTDVRVSTSVSITGNVVGAIQKRYYRFEKYAFNKLDFDSVGYRLIYPLLTQQKHYGGRDVNIITVVHSSKLSELSDDISIFGSDIGETVSSINESDIEERLAMLLSDELEMDLDEPNSMSSDDDQDT